jgi:3-hydroxyisobutyrate dehydrogenase
MARDLLRAGFELRVWDRTPAKAARVGVGARPASTPAQAADGADVLITMLTDGGAVADVMAGPNGALSTLAAGAVWIQMSTVGVDWSDRLAGMAAVHELAFVDAPVSGSSKPAEQGELEILASGAPAVRPRVQPIFDVLGRRTVWLDRVGDGSRLKLTLNYWLAVLVEGMVETITLAGALGLDPRLFLEAIAGGSLASDYAMAKGAAMLDAEFNPGFPLRHATKDVELALSAAHRNGVELPLAGALLPRWHQAIAADHGEDDVAVAITAAATAAWAPGSRQSVGAT